MRQRDPGVLRVPDDRRQRAKREDGEEKIEAGSPEFPAQSRNECKDEHDGDELESVGVLAKKSDPNQQTRDRPEPGKIRAALESQPERVYGCHPEENRERIDCHEEIADVEKRNGVE